MNASAREDVLARIRSAIDVPSPAGTVPTTTVPTTTVPAGMVPAGTGATETAVAGYRREGVLTGEALLDLLAERLADYRAQVHRVSAETLGAEIGAALAARGARRLVVPPGLGLALPDWAEATVDDGLTPAELDRFDGVVTRAAVAIAETGTIVLDGSADQGRRAITLVPDYHLCVVDAGDVVQLVPEAIARLGTSARRPLTWISGPSATSDIELERVEGVHGPRTLEVLLVAGPDDQ
jgi:L-lactate dehydrogenase complex protein LldG